MRNTMSDIYGINRITPRWGFHVRGVSFRRALPCAIDLKAFSPTNSGLLRTEIIGWLKLTDANKLNIFAETVQQKAESLTINSIGQRPMEQNTLANPKPRRGVIDLILNH